MEIKVPVDWPWGGTLTYSAPPKSVEPLLGDEYLNNVANMHSALELYMREEISIGRLAEMLRVPLQAAQDIAQLYAASKAK